MTGLLQVLGWTVPLTVIQAGFVAGAVWIVLRLVPRDRVRVRHGVAVLGLGVVGAAFAGTVGSLVVDWRAHVACWSRPAAAVPPRCAAHGVHVPALDRPDAPAENRGAVLDWIPNLEVPEIPGGREAVVRWTPGAGALGALWVIALLPIGLREWRCRRTMRAVLREATPVGAPATAVLADLADELGIGVPVRVRESAAIATPCVAGWRTPVVLLPRGLVRALGERELRGVLAHELAHVRRLDAITAAVSRTGERALFFNPFVRWIAGRVRDEREAACDRVGAEVGACSRLNYAEALLVLEGFRAIPGPGAGGALPLLGEGDLLGRVRRLVAEPLAARRSPRLVLLAIALAASLLAGAMTRVSMSGAALGSWAIMTVDLQERDSHTP